MDTDVTKGDDFFIFPVIALVAAGLKALAGAVAPSLGTFALGFVVVVLPFALKAVALGFGMG